MSLVIVDGGNLVMRCFHAQRKLVTRTGIETGGVYGSLRSLTSLFYEYPGWQLAIAWDHKARERKNILPEYKEHRSKDKTEEEIASIRQQLQWAQKACASLGLPSVRVYGLEADDIIGLLVEKYRKKMPIVIVSTDKDLYQLLRDQVSLLRLGEVFNIRSLLEKYGMTPSQYRLFHALNGDTSDGVPGIPGVGEKTVMDLVHGLPADFQYDHPDWERLSEICKVAKGARVRRVADNIPIVVENYTLVNLRPSPFIDGLTEHMVLDQLNSSCVDYHSFLELVWELEMDSIVGTEEQSVTSMGMVVHTAAMWGKEYERS